MKGFSKALLIGVALGIMVFGTIGCMNPSESGSDDVLKVGTIGFASTLEPTADYFSWVVVRYGIGETLVKFDDSMQVKP